MTFVVPRQDWAYFFVLLPSLLCVELLLYFVDLNVKSAVQLQLQEFRYTCWKNKKWVTRGIINAFANVESSTISSWCPCRQFSTRAFGSVAFFFFPGRGEQDFEKMRSTARSFNIDDDDRFCNVVKVEPPRNTAEALIIVSTAHTTVETTVTYERHRRFETMPTCEFGVRTNSKLARRLNPVSTFN